MALAHGQYSREDFDHSPLMFYYETTLACDLVCKHCRAEAQPAPHPEELRTEEAVALVEQVATFPRRPTMVFTGGDPLKRPDLFELLAHARYCGIEPVLTPSATPLATRQAFVRAKAAGVQRIGISLDGADPATHDAFRGWSGSFERTMQMLADARELGLAVQVNTSLCRRNFHQLDQIAELLAGQGIVMWAVFFLVPVGRALQEERLRPEEYEQAFARLWYHAQNQPFAVKTTEAPHYRRYVLQQGGDPLAGPRWEALVKAAGMASAAGMRTPAGMGSATEMPAQAETTPAAGTAAARMASAAGRASAAGMPSATSSDKKPLADQATQRADPTEAFRGHRAPLGVWDGRGVMFVSHIGQIFPSGFLPIECGRFPKDSVVQTYQQHPLFQALRRPDGFRGKCGRCEYRQICGGSRARAYAVTGDPLGSEPDCIYQPGSSAP